MNYLSNDNVQEILNLSRLQKSLLGQTQGEESNGRQPLAQWLGRLNGNIDTQLFQQAWDAVIQWHPVLRSIFRVVKKRDVQAVLKIRPIPVELIDLRDRSESAQQMAIEQAIHTHREPFAVADGPLMRVTLFQTGEQQAVFLWTSHQVILDEQSQRFVIADWLETYQALLRGEPIPSQERRPFKDYLTWVAQQDWSSAKDFFAAQFEGFEAPTQLLHGPRPSVSEQEGGAPFAARTLHLSEELTQEVQAVSAQTGVTPRVVVQAAWALLLGVYSGEETVSYGLQCAGRPADLAGAEQMVGPLGNTLPFFVRVNGEQTVQAFLTDVQEQVDRLAAFAYMPQHEVLTYGGWSDATLPFHSSLSIYDEPTRNEQGVRLETERLIQQQSQALSIDMSIGRVWEMTFTYATNVVAGETVERMMDHLHTILASLAVAPEALISQLNVLPEAERHQLFHDFNQTRLPAPVLDRLAHQVIEEQAALRPTAIAAICGSEQYTYAELNEQANRLAHWLRAQGFGRDDLAALFAERSLGMLVAILAVTKAGGAYVPLDSAHPDARIHTILESSRAKVIFTQQELAERSVDLARNLPTTPTVFCLDEAEQMPSVMDAATLSQYPAENPSFINQPQDLANVFFTSGSTGLPKGAMVEHMGMLNHLWAKINLLNLTETSIVAQNASHCFDISVWQFLAPLMVGGQVVIYPNDVATDPQGLFASVKRDRVTVLEMVPALIEMFLQASAESDPMERRLPDLLYMISTGEGLSVPLCRKWLQAYPDVRVVNTYGATECSDDTSHEVVIGECCDEDLSHVALGTPIPNFKFYLLDRWQRPVPIGCTGEVCMTGIGVGRGYLNDPERTAQAFVPNPFADSMGDRMYKTGDLARFLPDGRLAFVNRADFQVKVRGHRIELGEVEAALLKQESVHQGIAVVRPDSGGQNRILAYVVLAESGDIATLREALHEVLPEYMIPEHIIALPALPLNRNGKVDRKALPDPDDSSRVQEAYAAPRNEMEQALADIWSGVLEVATVGIDDNFFALGGHSLKTMQVRTRIKKHFGVDVSLKTLFEFQTIRDLAVSIGELAGNKTGAEQLAIVRLPQQDTYPMSHAQKRLYLIQRLEPHNTTYSLPVALELLGHLDVDCLQRAFQTIVDRHATLRTTFTMQDGQPVQRVAAQSTLPCPVEDLSHLRGEALEQAIAELIEAQRHICFDLEQGPLFSLRVIRGTAERHLLLLNIHHIISDGWSGGVLIDEFQTLYQAYRQGQSNPLQPLTIQYVDYAHWQNQRLENGELQDAERYWLEQFAGELPVLTLPTDHPRPPIQSFRGATQTIKLDAATSTRFHQLCQQQGATLFMGLLAALGTFLSRISGQEDLIIGTPEAGRNRIELEELIGFFVNTLAMRLDLSGNLTFLDLMERVKKTALDAYAHQEYPFDKLVEKVNPIRDLSRSPLFSVMFQVIRSQDNRENTQKGLTLRNVTLPTTGAHFDLTVTFVEQDNEWTTSFEYSTDLFDASTIARWMEHFQTLLANITEAPEQHIANLPLLTEAERNKLLVEWNDTKADLPTYCFHRLFEAQAAQTPDSTAVVFGREAWNYAELNGRANQLAHHLQKLGVGPDVLVGICLDRSPHMMVSMLGVLKAGGAFVPIDPAYPADRIAYMLEDSQVPVLITEQKQLSHLPQHEATILCVDQAQAWAEEPRVNPDSTVGPEHLIYVIYTSGSTGRPKGVLVEHQGLSHMAYSLIEAYGITADSRVLQFASFSFDASILEIFTTFLTGATLYMAPKEELLPGPEFAARLREWQISVITLPTTVLAALQDESFPDLKTVASAGEACTPEVVNHWSVGRRFVNVYGPTEITVCATVALCQSSSRPPAIGRPLANKRVYVLDAQMQPVPVGVVGEICVGGVGVARGYLNRLEVTAERFLEDPFSTEPGARLYKTGDMGRYLPDGNLEYMGRTDDQVKIRGFRIEIGEIEAALGQHPDIQKNVVVVHEDGAGDKRLVAYVTLRDAATTDAKQWRSYLQAKLPEYMIPSAFLVLDAMPLSPNGKVDRRALPKPDGKRAGDSYVAPRDPLELELAKVWEDVLQISPVGIDDNFFAIGGHSMKAMVLMGKIKSVVGIELPLALLLQKPTVAELADHLRGQTTTSTDCLIPFQQVDSDRPPLFLLHPQGGGVLSYFHLVQALGAEETVYAIQSVGYESDETPLLSMEEMADRYLAEIKRVAPEGPYRLAGWSFGGVVAFEMTQQLERAGEVVEFLGLLDVMPIHHLQDGHIEESMTERMALKQYADLIDLDLTALAGLEEEEVFNHVLQRAKESNQFPPGTTREMMRRKILVMMYNGIACFNYRCLNTIRADIHLFYVQEMSTKLPHPLVDPQEWCRYTQGEVHATAIPGNHHTLVAQPHVLDLAKAMRTALQPSKATSVSN